ncbi:histone-lysine N-methyltransferase [Lentinula edodes]|nr:histone-lysine N-methyltransferase [Lentinula edodes]
MSLSDHDSPKLEGSPATANSPTPRSAERSTSSAPSASSSKTSTPPPVAPTNSRKQSAAGVAIQFIGHLPVAREDALKTFTEIPNNCYQYKTLGRVRELEESMTCDCTFEPEYDNPELACGASSDCINRLTQIECLAGYCRCGEHCLNQRFQKKNYAPIEIVLTDKKGFGLRAEDDILKDSFIYEYVGDVVNNVSFKKRMRDYATEGIKHFYFMMLQKDEFIDATKSGGIGRFANHSCKPNCYVAKWTVDQHVRMGIFAKRNIRKDEELTFNYNVDRYGHQAQVCYCGEPNCVGFIGGKTQTETDISTMDELYLDALGITDDDELQEYKGTKKKKGKKIDDPDFMPTMKPVTEKEVPKVVQAIRQTQSKKMLFKLLSRLKITQEQSALRQVMRLRGYSLMKNILEDYMKDTDILGLAMECMFSWPLIARNKVEDSQVSVPVKHCMGSENESVKTWAEKLISHWESLELSYRIPRLPKQDIELSVKLVEEEEKPPIIPLPLQPPNQPRNHRSSSTWDDGQWRAPKRPRMAPVIIVKAEDPPPVVQGPSISEIRAMQNAELEAIIAAAKAEKAEAESKAEAEAKAEEERRQRKERAKAEGSSSNGKKRHRDREKAKKERRSEKDANKEVLKEKRLMKLISPIVVKSMSKHASALGHDRFKRHAKELTQKVAEREKKSSAYQQNKLDNLSDEKVAKIKKYAKEYIDKLLHRMDKEQGHRKPSSSASASVSAASTTPSGLVGSPSSAIGTPTSTTLPVDLAAVALDDAMDMDTDSELDEGEGEGEYDQEDDNVNMAGDEDGFRIEGQLQNGLYSEGVRNDPSIGSVEMEDMQAMRPNGQQSLEPSVVS